MLVRLTRPSVVSPKTEPGRILFFVTVGAWTCPQSDPERSEQAALWVRNRETDALLLAHGYAE